MEPFLDDKYELQFSCEDSEAHSDYTRSPTKGSFFYGREIPLGVQLGIIRDLFRTTSNRIITETRYATHDEIIELLRACTVLREGYYRRNYLKEDNKNNPTNLLGDSPECDHLQIGIRKFQKPKKDYGKIFEKDEPGCWVLGIVEALKTNKPDSFSRGEIFYCTVPNGTHHTLLPIIAKYCRRDKEIRSGIKILPSEDIKNYLLGGKNVKKKGTAPEKLNISIINSGWSQLLQHIDQIHYNHEELPLKLMEYIWHQKHKEDMMEGLERCFGQESINYQRQSNDSSEISFITCGPNGNSPELQKYMDEKEAARSSKEQADREGILESHRLRHKSHWDNINKDRALLGEPPVEIAFNPDSICLYYVSESSDGDYKGIETKFPVTVPLSSRSHNTTKNALKAINISSSIGGPPPIITIPPPVKAPKLVRYRKRRPVSPPLDDTPPPRVTEALPRTTRKSRRVIITTSSPATKTPSPIDSNPLVPPTAGISKTVSSRAPRSKHGRGRPRSLRTTARARGLAPR